MAKPALPFCITLNDLIKCGVGDVIVSMLTDARDFYNYDQRETGGGDEDFDDNNDGYL
jgi:serine/threonine-protein phosphatase 2A regulatory subunit B''